MRNTPVWSQKIPVGEKVRVVSPSLAVWSPTRGLCWAWVTLVLFSKGREFPPLQVRATSAARRRRRRPRRRADAAAASCLGYPELSKAIAPACRRRLQAATSALPSSTTAASAPASSRSLRTAFLPTRSLRLWWRLPAKPNPKPVTRTLDLTPKLTLALALTRSRPARAPRPSSAESRASARPRCPSSETTS